MIPFPNVIAGVLIGIANDAFLAVVLAAFAWGFVFCGYVWVADSKRAKLTITSFRDRGRRFLFGSPVLTFYGIEYVTALATSFLFGVVSYGIKVLIT
jgi:hypothetical protein